MKSTTNLEYRGLTPPTWVQGAPDSKSPREENDNLNNMNNFQDLLRVILNKNEDQIENTINTLSPEDFQTVCKKVDCIFNENGQYLPSTYGSDAHKIMFFLTCVLKKSFVEPENAPVSTPQPESKEKPKGCFMFGGMTCHQPCAEESVEGTPIPITHSLNLSVVEKLLKVLHNLFEQGFKTKVNHADISTLRKYFEAINDDSSLKKFKEQLSDMQNIVDLNQYSLISTYVETLNYQPFHGGT